MSISSLSIKTSFSRCIFPPYRYSWYRGMETTRYPGIPTHGTTCNLSRYLLPGASPDVIACLWKNPLPRQME